MGLVIFMKFLCQKTKKLGPHISQYTPKPYLILLFYFKKGFKMMKDTVAKVGTVVIKSHQLLIKYTSLSNIGCHMWTKICNASNDNYALRFAMPPLIIML